MSWVSTFWLGRRRMLVGSGRVVVGSRLLGGRGGRRFDRRFVFPIRHANHLPWGPRVNVQNCFTRVVSRSHDMQADGAGSRLGSLFDELEALETDAQQQIVLQ